MYAGTDADRFCHVCQRGEIRRRLSYRHRAAVRVDGAAADILLFLANNPGCETAGEICRMRGMKPALVSFHIDRLVGEGYLLRQPVPGDRRKTALVLTAQAQPIVAEGRELQRAFADRLAEGLSAEDLAHFRRCVAIFDRNIEQIRAEKSKRTEIQNP